MEGLGSAVLGEVVAERSTARISAATMFRGFLLTRRAPLLAAEHGRALRRSVASKRLAG